MVSEGEVRSPVVNRAEGGSPNPMNTRFSNFS